MLPDCCTIFEHAWHLPPDLCAAASPSLAPSPSPSPSLPLATWDRYLSAIADNIKRFCTDPIQKEAFIETFKDRHALTFVIEPEQDEESPYRSSYTWTINNGGILELHIPKIRFCSNVSTACDDLTKTCSGDSPLTVATRKNIADAQKKLATHLKTIKTATGIDFEVEIDWVVMAEVCKERGYENRAGDMLYDSYLSALASNIKRFCDDAIQKEAFLETFKERHAITFVIEGEQDEDSPYRSNYSWTTNNGGVLVVHLPKIRFCSNVSVAGEDLSKTCSGDSPLTVATRKNIADAQKKLATNLKTIKTATGIDFELEIDWVVMAEVCKGRGYEDRAGDIMYETYLAAIASNIKRFCEDPIQKEAFLETFKDRHAISFVVEGEQDEDSPYRSSYAWTSNKEGVLVIHLPKIRFCSNVSCAGEDLSKTCSGDSPLTVATRKNIADAQKKLAANLKTIKTATGIDFELEIDWVVMAEVCKERGYENRAGDMLYDTYLAALASNIKRFCEDAIQKEAFLETFKDRHAISFVIEPEQDQESPYRSSYAWTSNKEGVLVIHIPKIRFCSNVSAAGDDLTKTCSGDSPLTVATRKNISDQEKNRVKNIGRINKAVGVEFETEIDWVVFAAGAKARGYEDRAAEILYDWYFAALASSLEKLCADSMSKEAVQESCEKKVISFTIYDGATSDLLNSSCYSQCTFEDGVLKVLIPKDRLCSNVGETGSDIESRL